MNTSDMDSPVAPLASTCGACGSDKLEPCGVLPLYVRGGTVPTPIRKCRACGTYFRDVDYDDIVRRGHFDVASYTDPLSEARWSRNRRDFFRYLMALSSRHLRKPLSEARVLDFGCSFGHLIDLLRAEGAECAGVEIVDMLRIRLISRGVQAFRSIDDLPSTEVFDWITFIDSLHYVEAPRVALEWAHQHLSPDGLLMIRIANRTPLLNCLRALLLSITSDQFSTVKHNFSVRGVQTLLTRTGFAIERVYQYERGKRGMRPLTWLYYRLTLAASVLVRKPLTPGLILICRPQQ